MRKTTICLVAVLMGAWVSSFGQSNGLPQWKVVKEVHMMGHSGAVPTTVIFAPTDDGLFRLSALMSVHSQPQPSNPSYTAYWNWTDRAGNGAFEYLPFCFEDACFPNLDQSVNGRVFSLKAGTSVTFAILASDPPPQDTNYDVAFTIEKLTH